MKMVLYGLPCAGKDYLLSRLDLVRYVKGSEWLNSLCDNRFRELAEGEKVRLRKAFIRYVSAIESENVVVNGHYAFPKNGGYDVVFTEEDGECYDVFAYLDTPVEVVHERMQKSEKNAPYAGLSVGELQAWRDFEVDALFREALKRGKEFILLDDDLENALCFTNGLLEGEFSTSYEVAGYFAKSIAEAAGDRKRIILADGDKTLTVGDLTKSVSSEDELKAYKVFDGDRYTTYQFWKVHQIHRAMNDIEERFGQALAVAEFDRAVLDDLSQIDAFKVVVTAGLMDLWTGAAAMTGVMDMAVGSDTKAFDNMSQLGKAYLSRYLREKGYEVLALGDNMVDYYMLTEADRGYLIAHAKKNASAQRTVLGGTKLKQPKYNQIKFEGVAEVNSIHEDIE